jgi:hypothetical protein
MVFCENCGENVLPKTYFTWSGFVLGLGIFYLIYIITKIPQCPNCNFPMPRRNMVFAVQLPQNLIKLARIGALQLTHLKDSLTSASRRSSLEITNSIRPSTSQERTRTKPHRSICGQRSP